MGRTLLVVDDVRTNREILKKILGNEYDIHEASQGQEALDILKQRSQEISAVLLDLSMPVMDGFEVLAFMQEDKQLRQIPVVVMTGMTDESSEAKALIAGANDYIAKPYNPTIVRQRIFNVINLRETAAVVNELQRDRLTGLYSRNTFIEKASAMIAEKEPGYYVIGCFDIDGFKLVNDQFGTSVGDEVLCNLARIFETCFDELGGICSRMMADEFAALYPNSLKNSEQIERSQAQAAQSDGTIPPISFSIGRYVVDDPTLSVSTMYDRATLAMASVKGRYDVHVAQFDESMRDQIIAERQIVTEMNHALEAGQFEAWYQPQYDHATGALVGAEALARWRHPQRGLISPGEFIPIFERNGFIYELDKYIWNQTCNNLHEWIEAGRNPLPVSVNISRADVYRPDLVDVLTGLIETYQIPVELLRLEITESAFSKSTDQIIQVVRRLVDLGFTVEIDDFGSGYSSLNTLKDVPAQIIKLDMMFLKSTEDSQRGGNIVESVVRMAKWLGMSVIAEGVETLNQADFLKSIGCFLVQGFLYAKPMPRADYEALAARSVKQPKTATLETVEHLDNNAFWDPDSLDTLIFNSYLGGACIYEYGSDDGSIEFLRVNDKYAQMIGGVGMSIEDVLKLDWSAHLDETSLEELPVIMEEAAATGEERTIELALFGLPGCAETTFLRSTLRVIARSGLRWLVYGTSENITAQRLAEKRRQLANDQLSFLENVAHDLLAQSDTEAGVNTILHRMLEYFDSDRAYVFEFDYGKGITRNTYELCAEGVEAEKDCLQDVPIDMAAYWLQTFRRQSYVDIEDVDALGANRQEKELLQQQGISSLIAVPMRREGELIGFVGLDEPRQKRDQIERLSALGDYVVVLLTRRDLNAKLMIENQEKLAVMDGIPGGFVRMQVMPDGCVIPRYQSEGLRKLLGMNVDEVDAVYGDDALAGVHPDDVGIVRAAIGEMLKRGETNHVCYRLKKGDGSYIWVMIFGKMRKSRNGDVFLNVYYADATEEKRREDIRTELMDNLPCAAAIYEVQENVLHVVYLNRCYRELLGHELADDDDASVLDAVHPDDRVVAKEALAHSVRERLDGAANIRIWCKDGEYRTFRVAGRSAKRENGASLVFAIFVLAETEK